jgi:hypothetical protein
MRVEDNHKTAFDCHKGFLSKAQPLLHRKGHLPARKHCHARIMTNHFFVFVDASLLAVGAVLCQLDDDGINHRPIAFVSRKWNQAQTKYSTIERESFAVIFALQKFDLIILGSEVILYSDHNLLQYIATGSVSSAKLTRWAPALQRL